MRYYVRVFDCYAQAIGEPIHFSILGLKFEKKKFQCFYFK
ncbi:MAG: hypothetical protein RIS47_533 [Bacteroidota bacterium]|jgi:hypothetical protein